MKTKITAVLMAMMFFLSISVFADNDTPPKTKVLPDCGCGEPTDDSSSLDYTRPPWWISNPESLPDHR